MKNIKTYTEFKINESYDNIVNFSDLVGQTITKIEINDDSTEIRFYVNETEYLMYHSQDCCENVSIDDIVGDLDDLIKSPILKASEDTNRDDPDHRFESVTWTFYNISTIKGHVTIRWCGTSNGYYSEAVSFIKVN